MWSLYRELMNGRDGKLSFTKHMLVALFWAFVAGAHIPVVIALALILASKSVNLLYEWLVHSHPEVPVK